MRLLRPSNYQVFSAPQCNFHFMCRHAPLVAVDLASQSEDRILETLKKVGATVDSAVSAFSNIAHLGDRATNLEVGHAIMPGKAHTLGMM